MGFLDSMVNRMVRGFGREAVRVCEEYQKQQQLEEESANLQEEEPANLQYESEQFNNRWQRLNSIQHRLADEHLNPLADSGVEAASEDKAQLRFTFGA